VKYGETGHTAGDAGFDLSLGNGEDCAAKGFRHVTAENHADGTGAGGKLADLDIIPQAGQNPEGIDHLLTTVKHQQNQHQVGHAALFCAR